MAQEIRADARRDADPELWRGFQAGHARVAGQRRGYFRHAGILRRHGFAVRACARLPTAVWKEIGFLRESWNAINRPDKAVSLIEDEVLELAAQELGMASIAR